MTLEQAQAYGQIKTQADYLAYAKKYNIAEQSKNFGSEIDINEEAKKFPMETDDNGNTNAKVLGGITLALGLGAMYLLFFHNWEDKPAKKLAGVKSKKKKK